MSHARFQGSKRATLTLRGDEIKVVLADGFGLRFKGLMQVPPEELEPLLFPKCRSLHMYWMKTPIDVVWLDLKLEGEAGEARVIDVVESLPPRRNAAAPKGLDRDVKKRVAALELAPGTARELGFVPEEVLSVRVEPGTKG